jgi:phosphotransferase system enzyme I (PtsI)
MNILTGIPASPGIVKGKVLIKGKEAEPTFEKITDIDDEKNRFKEARLKSIQQLETIHQKTLIKMGEKDADIFLAHITMLEDVELVDAVEANIESESCNAEWALKMAADVFIEMFNSMDDPYLKERALDIIDITKRVRNNLMGIDTEGLANLEEAVIIIAHDLTPSDTAQMDHTKVLGFVTEIGGKTSHTAIIARTIEIPAVVGLSGILDHVKANQEVIIDGRDGKVYIEPDDETMVYYKEEKIKIEAHQLKLDQIKNSKAMTKDGVEVEVAANIGSPDDLAYIDVENVYGVGLFRTEFLYMSRDNFPTEEEQFEAYKKVAEAMKQKAVVIRTLDIGGDKELSYLKIDKELNPFLGFRAIRLCLERVELWKTQLRAILRASAYGNIKIMFPMIATYNELIQAKGILQEVRDELKAEGIPFNEKAEVGMMMETPAAAVMADVFAKEVDFFSIGTNDLIQYTIAVDRMNPNVSHLYSPYDPAVIRLIQKIIESAHEAGIWAGMCGEAASDKKAIPLWLGLGLDEFSMSGSSFLDAKWIIQNLDSKEAKNLVNEVLAQKQAADVETVLNKLYSNN